MSKELMRRAIIDMILWTDSEEKIKIIFRYLLVSMYYLLFQEYCVP